MKFFVDRDLGPAIGQALAAVGVDAVNHTALFDPDAPDADWIPAVTADDRVILSKDRHLKSRPAERAAFEQAGARCFIVTAEGQNRLGLLRILLDAWDEIVRRVGSEPGPFMYGIAKDGRMTQWIPADGPDGPAARRSALAARRAARQEPASREGGTQA